jgi:hypothetical protein
VIAAMRVLWNIPAETGKPNKLRWKKDAHCWQALAVVSCHLNEILCAVKHPSHNKKTAS